MEDTTRMSLRNRTGIMMSPIDTAELLSATQEDIAVIPGDLTAAAELRREYIEEAEGLGSVPVPGTPKGMAKAGIQMLSGNRPQVLVDKLGERLAFERSGTRLYEALLAKCQADTDSAAEVPIEQLRLIRDQEFDHFKMLVGCLETLGADPTAQTPSADLVGVESMGLMQVLTDPRTSLTQSLHAIITAELSDGVGWEMLIALAESSGQAEMADQFRTALVTEQEHLEKVSRWYADATMKELKLTQAA